MKKTPFFSILIPTYNRCNLLKATIEIILAQTFKDFELIISDNASTDETEKVVKSFKDKRIKYFKNKENIGAENNYKKVFSYAKGEYLFSMGDDDFILFDDSLEKVKRILDKEEFGFLRLNLIERKLIGQGLRKSIIIQEEDIKIEKNAPAGKIIEFFNKIAAGHLAGLVIKNSTTEIKLFPHHQVELDSGVFLPKAILYLINQGLVGLEVFAGIPATVGGATAVSMHGVGNLWSDFVIAVKKYQGVILSVKLQLKSGDPVKAMQLFKSIQTAKFHQPQQSSGCIFKNPQGQSAGQIIDQQLKLKGVKIGQAQISVNHANFIVNLGQAKFKDVLQLINLIQTRAKQQLNLNLNLEIIIYE